MNGVSITYNAALNKPAYQSSGYVDSSGRDYPASLANDGDKQTRSPHCMVSERETNPYWVVDLETPSVVSRVDLTSTTDSGIRLSLI